MFKFEYFVIVMFTLLANTIQFGFVAYDDVKFELFTQDHSRENNEYDLLKASEGAAILTTKWRTDKMTRMYIHGYRTSRKVFFKFRDKFLDIADYNFIAVNWLKGSRTVNYLYAKNRVKKVSHLFIVGEDTPLDCFRTKNYTE